MRLTGSILIPTERISHTIVMTLLLFTIQQYMVITGITFISLIFHSVYYFVFTFLVFKNHFISRRYKRLKRRFNALTIERLYIITLFEIPFEILLYTITVITFTHYRIFPYFILFFYFGQVVAFGKYVYLIIHGQTIK